MTTVNQMLSRFNKIDFKREASRIVKETANVVIQLNRDQLFIGEDAQGNRLPAYHSTTYARKKYGMNTLPGIGTPDYYLTGRLFAQMQIDFSKADTFRVISKVAYFDDVVSRGGDPMGLQPDSKQQYYDNAFRPRLMAALSEKTGVLLG